MATLVMAMGLLGGWSAPANAQVGDTVLVSTITPDGFGEDRNRGVTQLRRPDYDQIGTNVGAFNVQASLDTRIGATSNVYLRPDDKVAGAYVSVSPSILVRSNWRRHALILRAEGDAVRFIGESPRNENNWLVGAEGRYDIHSSMSIRSNVSSRQVTANRFFGNQVADDGATSLIRQDSALVRAAYTDGRGRLSIVGDYTDVRFGLLRRADGTSTDQSSRDRSVVRATGLGEYAVSPSVGLFVQAGLARTAFGNVSRGTTGDGSSAAVQLSAGATFDIAGFAQGNVGLGYITRTYELDQVGTVDGVSVASSIRFFPHQLTTITIRASREIEDQVSNNPRPFWETRIGIDVDRELRRNLLARGTINFVAQDYFTRDVRSAGVFGNISGRYLVSRRMEMRAAVGYGMRIPNKNNIDGQFNEFRASFGITFKH